MIATNLQVAGGGEWPALAHALADGPDPTLPVLVNLGVRPGLDALVQRCRRFAESCEGGEGLVVGILTPAADAGTLDDELAAAGAWAFTRHAALAWAPRRIRLNMIGCGIGLPADTDPVALGRSAARLDAEPVGIDDVVRTVRAIAGWPSMTGQFIRLGGA